MRNWDHFESIANKIQEVYASDSKHAKECFGVSTLLLLRFDDPKLTFPKAAVHAQFNFRDRQGAEFGRSRDRAETFLAGAGAGVKVRVIVNNTNLELWLGFVTL